MSERLLKINQSLQPQNRLKDLRIGSKIKQKQLINMIIPEQISQHFVDIYHLIQNNAAIFQQPDNLELNRQQQRQQAMKQGLIIMKGLNIDLEKDQYRFIAAMYAVSYFGIGPAIKGLIQYLLYIKTILVFKSNSYHQQCLNRAKKLQDLGSFSLTELHHGSFSRGIATEAVYHHQTKQFIINTNGEKGMKFWIGNTSQTANKTVLWAQLIIGTQSYGPHCFIMQLRDDSTHEVLPGLTIGDCGFKNGLNSIDNGYIIIKNVRVPVYALLGKLGHVDNDGKYQSKTKSAEQSFGRHMSPLSNGRAVITLTCLSQSMSALTIALRYVCQRRQFRTKQSEPEKLLIDYPVTRYRLMTPLATNIVFYFAGVQINKLYINNSHNLTDPTQLIVTELHALSAVLKAKASWFTSSAITQSRQLLGGHGYSAYSGFLRLYHDNDINSTWEGDNHMLLQQTSKYILKAIKTKNYGSIMSLSFVAEGFEQVQISQQTLKSLPQLRTILQSIFIDGHSRVVKQKQRIKQQAKKLGLKNEEAQSYIWNHIQSYFCNEMALAYEIKDAEYNKIFLINCLKLWTYTVLLRASFHNLEGRSNLQKLVVQLCNVIYPDSVIVTDILCAPSSIIGSPFAQENGQGMKLYINLLFSGRSTFKRVPWFQDLIKLKQAI